MTDVGILLMMWIFMKDTYGMSSRYALQYQVGIIGIFLTFALVCGKKKTAGNDEKCHDGKKTGTCRRCPWIHGLAILITAVILGGNVATTVEEFNHGQHRKNHNIEVRNVLLNFENEDEETLQRSLEFFKPGTREALQILKDNGWNIFKVEDES